MNEVLVSAIILLCKKAGVTTQEIEELQKTLSKTYHGTNYADVIISELAQGEEYKKTFEWHKWFAVKYLYYIILNLIKFYVYVLTILFLVLFLLLPFSLFATEHLVEMKGMKFVPENITIKKNDTVVFRNTTNTLHNVETKDKKLKSKMLKKGEEFKYKFDKVEKIEYYCKPHKNMGMVGTVKVEE